MFASKHEEIQEPQHPPRSHAKFREILIRKRFSVGFDMVEVAIKAISALEIRDLSKLTLAFQIVEFLINLTNQGCDCFL